MPGHKIVVSVAIEIIRACRLEAGTDFNVAYGDYILLY